MAVMESMSFLMNPVMWIIVAIIFIIFNFILGILIFVLFKMTHAMTELKAFFTDTPIGMFFMENKFIDWRPVTPINGIVYDKKYGPFMVGATYISKKTKNMVLAFDVDIDGDRTTDVRSIAENFKNISNNEESISKLRNAINSGKLEIKSPELKNNIKNITSFIRFGTLKQTLRSIVPHNIKSKIEKTVAERMIKYGKVDTMQAVIVFGAMFGIIVLGAIIVKMTARKSGVQ